MKRIAGVLFVVLVGCGQMREFGRGFQDKGMEMAGDLTADALSEIVVKKLGDDFKEVKDAVSTIPASIPKPAGPEEQGVWYGLGALVAYITGSLGKGAIRKYAKKT